MSCEHEKPDGWSPLGGRRFSDTLWQFLFLVIVAVLVNVVYSTMSELRQFSEWRKDMNSASECYRRGSGKSGPPEI